VETQSDWLEFAKKHTVRKLEEEVRLVGDRGKRPGDRLGSKPQRYWLHLPLSERAHVLVESAFTKLRRARKGTASPEELIEEMAELVLAMRLESEDAEDGIEPGASSKRASPFKVLIHVKAETGESWIDTSEGRVELSPEEVQEEIEDGAEVEMVEEFAPRGAAASSATEPSTPERSIRFGERGSVPKELRAAPATQETRRQVFERHGNRCVICGRLLTLSNRQTHHPEAHANGGSSDARDLLPYCDECHGSEHQGLLSARWESGEIIPIDANGEPLEKQESPAEVLAASPRSEEHTSELQSRENLL